MSTIGSEKPVERRGSAWTESGRGGLVEIPAEKGLHRLAGLSPSRVFRRDTEA